MTYSAEERAAIASIAQKAAGSAADIGAESLERLFLGFPQTKTYFPNFNLSSGSSDLRSHGGKVVSAIISAANALDGLDQNLSALSELHARKLMVDPGNFRLLSHCIQVTLAARYPSDFNAVAQSAWDKFLSAVSAVLVSKYR